jgi:hypothetical protein
MYGDPLAPHYAPIHTTSVLPGNWHERTQPWIRHKTVPAKRREGPLTVPLCRNGNSNRQTTSLHVHRRAL